MPLFVRLRGPQVTLQRRKRGCSRACPKFKKWGLVPLLSFVFLGIAVASVGIFIILEAIINQTLGGIDRRMRRHGSVPNLQDLPPVPNEAGQLFKIRPLLNASAPSVELSAQITLNRLYGIYNRGDVLKYYNSIRCKARADHGSCKNFTIVSKSAGRKRWDSLKPCRSYPTGLKGDTFVALKESPVVPIESMDKEVLRAIKPGGWWEPEGCLARHSVAIVIPYKDRWDHLTTLLNYLHPLLQRQEVRYKLFVSEQFGNGTFNKGVLMNAAFLEALKEELFHCFIFHDVDLIPESDYNMYTCPDMPRHMSVAVDELNYKLPYYVLVGGAFAIRTDHFFRVNGYSNFYWGWGGEDDDMGFRVLQAGLKITRPLAEVGRYTMIKHVKRKHTDRHIHTKLVAIARKRYRLEGLNSVQYRLVRKKVYPWYTNILVDVGVPHPMLSSRRRPKFLNLLKQPTKKRSFLMELFSLPESNQLLV